MLNNTPYWLDNQSHTGSQYPYYLFNNKSELQFTFDMEQIIDYIPLQNRQLEAASIIEILHSGYIFGNKTLIQSLNRAPWLSKLHEDYEWKMNAMPKHGNNQPQTNIPMEIKDLLYKELLGYLNGKNKIGILLSGGLDSRIIAGILKETQLNNDFRGDVVVYNWGVSRSRDVIYARKIAETYNWEYKYFPLSAESLKDNFYTSLSIGAEISPVHLHRMSEVRDDTETEIIIAGTYGDSLGRGLYSGIHVSALKNMVKDNMNKFSLLKNEVMVECEENILTDYYLYTKNLTTTREEFQLREIEQNAHYLRRMLGTAMSVIAQKKPIYQMFTSPEIVNYVWGLDETLRTDYIYKEILKTLPMDIGNIPYAKTGKSFIGNSTKTDSYLQSNHKYGTWLRNDLKNFITEELDMNKLDELGIFNSKSIEIMYDSWANDNYDGLTKNDQIISWLTVLCMFTKKHMVFNGENYKLGLKDQIQSIMLKPKLKSVSMKYKIKDIIRK